ncbi:Uma2 family endonuclease [Amycolatopsis rubida]|uniref:Putative restriction endonuclease n=1 Tax=Amycolatopsis rubida TaxID=112413 RepID=A0A1I5YIQ8_9PSEU|nr:Uma2 family endonuclease [Amycolatopsis rubida]SFQ43787.1 Putative restriction endonuclease [Amycolatopsis rubida]
MSAPAEHDTGQSSAPWLSEVLALPEEQLLGTRIEAVDGALLMSPAPTSSHQRLLQRLQRAMAPELPDDLELLPGVNVRCGESRLLSPDFVIVTCPDVATTWYPASEVLLAAEIESASTRVQDRIFEKALYAEALIPYYLLVDPEQEAATLYALADGDYLPHAKSEGGVLTLAEPFPAELDLRA